jgi:cell division protein ZipA
MAEELRLILTIVGVLAIGGILGHGLWSVRKNKDELRDLKTPPRNEPGFDSGAKHNSGLDDHGVGKPRTLGGSVKKEPVINTDVSASQNLTDQAAQTPIGDATKPQGNQEPIIEFGAADPVPQKPEPTQTIAADQTSADAPVAEPEVQPEPSDPSEVLIIHVSMPDNQTIAGASLLPMLVAMGFKFGEMDIFHRHEDSAGVGPVLFSLASMYNPGTFDIDNMEQMSTRGLSLFMTLPCYGDGLKNFNLMHNAAKKVAEEFGAQILDSHRSVMTVQTTRHYVEKIREFERKQLING